MKKFYLVIGVLPFILSACGTQRASFYGKTFVYKGTFDNLDERVRDNFTARHELTTNFSSIDWTRSSKIDDHSSASAVIAEMAKQADDEFKLTYGTNFSIVINAKESGWATVYSGAGQTGYQTELNDATSSILLKDASQVVEYTLFNNYEVNGEFVKVSLGRGVSQTFVQKIFTFYYNQPIEGLDGVQVTYKANFLPK